MRTCKRAYGLNSYYLIDRHRCDVHGSATRQSIKTRKASARVGEVMFSGYGAHNTKESDFLTPQLRFHVCTNGETSIVLTVTSTCSDAAGSEAADMATAKRAATHSTILSGTTIVWLDSSKPLRANVDVRPFKLCTVTHSGNAHIQPASLLTRRALVPAIHVVVYSQLHTMSP